MDGTWNSRNRNYDRQEDQDDEMGLAPVPEEEPHAPPVDLDEREGEERSTESIVLPEREEAHDEEYDSSFDNQIDELLPRPQDEPYHDDDEIERDPYNVVDEVDEMMPRPTGDARDEVDDFSTGEELDVETAPLGHSDRDHDHDIDIDVAGEENLDPPGMRIDHDPVNDESGFVASTYTTASAAREISGPDAVTSDAPEPEPLTAADGTTTCPTCGRQTDALRFCGYCGEQLTEERRGSTATTTRDRLQERATMLLEPLAHWTRPGPVRLIMAAGAVLILLSLLANNGALAIIFGAAILPLILIYWCTELDVFENEPLILIAGFGLASTVIGALIGWLSSLVVTNSWFDAGVLNYGAAGFGGRFAEAAGSAPFIVWLISGILLPVGALAAIIGGPIAMRQTLSLRNEIMDGLTIAAAMGAGFSLGTAIVFAAPMIADGGPASDASGWTLTIIGLTIIRPIIWTLSGAMLGAAAWMYLRSRKLAGALIPAVAGIVAPLLFTLVSIQLHPNGLWPEIIWGILVSVAVALVYRRTLSTARTEDRKVLGNDHSRVVCPNCHKVTPDGAFCSSCGADLSPERDTGADAWQGDVLRPVGVDKNEVIATPVDDEAPRA